MLLRILVRILLGVLLRLLLGMPRCGQPKEAAEHGEGGRLEGGHVVDAKVAVHLDGAHTQKS